MKSRQEIKAIAKARFQANYWNCVLTALLITAVIGLLNWSGTVKNVQEITQQVQDGFASLPALSNITISARFGGGGLLSLLLTGPLSIGLYFFFIRNVQGRIDEISVTTPFTEAFRNYGRKLGGTLWMELFVFLWSLLFVIPGIIKVLSYSMTQYILADCPDVKARDALKLSMRMMHGHKGELFVLGLSFIGWLLLTALTFGILGIFYTGPYMSNTFAQYYLEIKEQALRTGVVTAEQLAGVQEV